MLHHIWGWIVSHTPRSERGQDLAEYGMLIALVALALIAVLTIFGGGISTWFAAKTGQITTV